MLPGMEPMTRRQFSLSILAAGLGAAGLSRAADGPPAIDPGRYTTQTVEADGRRVVVRAYEGLPVVARPVEPEYQALNLYVPEAYFRGERVGRYDAASAPIFLPNSIGGYMPARPATPTQRMGPRPASGAGAMATALARGFVVAAPGARGRTLHAADGRWTGKAPAAIVDLKAAVRWLRANAGRLPGNTERIVSNGTSAGGAMSALLGASGNSPDYAAELRALGAAEQRDDVFAVSAYCPITNLAHADAAYEWQFDGLEEYRNVTIAMLDFKVQRSETVARLDERQRALSRELQAEFVAYVNGLDLHDTAGRLLRLDERGGGTLAEHLAALLAASAQRALDQGQDLSAAGWLQRRDGRVTGADFRAWVRAVGRMKGLPAFDGLALETGENQLFGDERTDLRHFTDFSQRHAATPGATRADAVTVQRMDAMHYALDRGTRAAPHWRIRHGTRDRDTSIAVPALLAAALRARGLDVDLALPWDRPHGGDYDLDELFDWIEQRVAAG